MTGMRDSNGDETRKNRPYLLVILIAAAGLALFFSANAHLFYVAVTTQPDCVPHLKGSGEAAGAYRAAKSSC
jgi:hypothetical protein